MTLNFAIRRADIDFSTIPPNVSFSFVSRLDDSKIENVWKVGRRYGSEMGERVVKNPFRNEDRSKDRFVFKVTRIGPERAVRI